jgi:peptidoglycan-associated lipoprotein
LLALVAALGLAACGGNPPPAPPPPPPPAPTPPPPAPTPEPTPVPEITRYEKIKMSSIDEIERMGLFEDVHFDFDKSDIRAGDADALKKNADVLKEFDFLRITVEGHCDDRGTVEYNLALGERRAQAAYDYLVSLGVPAARLKTVSYGKEVQVCSESNEDCWQRNRRAHLTVSGKN